MSKSPLVPPELSPLADGRRLLSPWTQAELAAAGVPALTGMGDKEAKRTHFESPSNLEAMAPAERSAAIAAAATELAGRGLLPLSAGGDPRADTQRAELTLLVEALDAHRNFLAIETAAGKSTPDPLDSGKLSVSLGGAKAVDGDPLAVSLSIDRLSGDCTAQIRTLACAGEDLADHLLHHACVPDEKVIQGELTIAVVGHSLLSKSTSVIMVQAAFAQDYATVFGDKKGLKSEQVRVPKPELGGYFSGLLHRSFG